MQIKNPMLSSCDEMLGFYNPVQLDVKVFGHSFWFMLMGGCKSLCGSKTYVYLLVIACKENFILVSGPQFYKGSVSWSFIRSTHKLKKLHNMYAFSAFAMNE